ncbi:MAG: CidA/LrgA family protein [Lachnospiraceae bacterium]
MKILKQVMVIGLVTFAGEFCSVLLPLPVPASVYGMLLLFMCLQTGVIKLSYVEDTADFLVSVMPVMFVAPCVSLMDSISSVLGSIPAIVLICLATTVTTISVTGAVAQCVIRIRREKEKAGNCAMRKNGKERMEEEVIA